MRLPICADAEHVSARPTIRLQPTAARAIMSRRTWSGALDGRRFIGHGAGALRSDRTAVHVDAAS
jgi:hypothetical protein